ncbi:MAG TPA: hypothetical protein PKA64_01950 [Myxococcota bacterium]|nr:hypothetical protein [Myxococcota bacterium]
MSFSFRGVVNKAKARAYLQQLTEGLRQIAGGAAQARASIRIANYFNGRVKGELGRKRRTGKAQGTARAIAETRSVVTTLERYVLAGNFKPGATSRPARPAGHIQWSWFNGVPQRDLKQAAKIVAEETEKLLTPKG